MVRVIETAGFPVDEYGTYFSRDEIGEVPHTSGLYGLFWNEQLRYVGRSNDIRVRLSTWIRRYLNKDDYIPFTTYDWFSLLNDEDIYEAEDYIIKYYQPHYNIYQRE